MKLGFTVRHLFHVNAQRLFAYTNDAPNFVSFTGFGPVPGIVKATYVTEGPPRLGSRRTMLKTDGSEHTEEIVAFDVPTRHVSRITGISPPFSWLVRWGEDDWRFIREGSGTLVERTFTFELTSPFAAIVAAPLLHLSMRGAAVRDLRNVEKAVNCDGLDKSEHRVRVQ